MQSARLFLLGPPRLETDQPITIGLRRAVALLAFLAVTVRPQTREKLAGLLWPDSDEADARGRLRRTLHRLHELADRELISSNGDALSISSDVELWVDCRAFEAAATAGLAAEDGRSAESSLSQLAAAAATYHDDFLAGFGVPDSPPWEEWQFLERERLRQLYGRVLERLVGIYLEQEAWEPGLEMGRRWLALDPLNESAYRALLRLYSLGGQRAAALRQYQECVRMLSDELGVPPEPETTRLYEAIRSARPAPVSTPATRSEPRSESSESSDIPPAAHLPPARAVGREPELRILRHCLERALDAERQLVLVTGEAGIGKTSLVRAFLADLHDTSAWLGHGQCLELRGAGEPYLPILEALGRLAQGPEGQAVTAVLAQRAPTWLVQMPWLVNETLLQALQPRVIGATRERMLREMAEALAALSRERPLVLVIEDLHWADVSTVDLITHIAYGTDPARLLVVGTLRPEDSAEPIHPVHQTARALRARGRATELGLQPLDQAAVAAYLTDRLGATDVPDELGRLVRRRTDGNPLFMVTLVEAWVNGGALADLDGTEIPDSVLQTLEQAVPDTLRLLIEQQVERLAPDDLELLEVASVAGPESPAAVVAAATGASVEQVERACHRLARQGSFLTPLDPAEWPDGEVCERFGFSHQLYQQVIYARLPAGRLARLHRAVGESLERAHGEQAALQAPELAHHFVHGRDTRRAVLYLKLAAERALNRGAPRESIEHLRAGLAQLQAWPETPERASWELSFHAMLAPALILTDGWASTDSDVSFNRAYALCREFPASPLRHFITYASAVVQEFRGNYRFSQELMEQRLLEESDPDPDNYLVESQDLLACSLFHQGQFEGSLDRAARGLEACDPNRDHALIAAFGEHPAVQFRGWQALTLAFLGQLDDAVTRAREGLQLAQNHQYSLSSAQAVTAWIYQLREEPASTREWAEASLVQAEKHGFPYRVAVATVFRGWALAVLGERGESIQQIRDGLASIRTVGAMLQYPFFLALLADAHGRGGDAATGLIVIDEALGLMRADRGFFYDAELHRLRGDLLLQAGGNGSIEQAQVSFDRALALARGQRSRLLELKAAASAAQLRRFQDPASDSVARLRACLADFEETAAPNVVKQARTVLEQIYPTGATVS